VNLKYEEEYKDAPKSVIVKYSKTDSMYGEFVDSGTP
jgi:hypothetical protein